MATKQKFKVPTFLVECDDLVIEGEDGEELRPRAGQWVRFYKRLPGRMVKLMLRAMRFQQFDDDDPESAGSLEQTLDDLLPMLASSIHSWNWTNIWTAPDENGEHPSLPSPPSADDIWDLDIGAETFYLIGKLMGQTQTPKA